MRLVRPPQRSVTITRVPIYHEGTFQAIVSAAQRARARRRYQGRWWLPLEEEPGFGLYRPSEEDLRMIQERVESYEFSFYSRLLQTSCGSDGAFRPHTQLRRAPSGALVALGKPAGLGVGNG